MQKIPLLSPAIIRYKKTMYIDFILDINQFPGFLSSGKGVPLWRWSTRNGVLYRTENLDTFNDVSLKALLEANPELKKLNFTRKPS
jgi:hypothetical protein